MFNDQRSMIFRNFDISLGFPQINLRIPSLNRNFAAQKYKNISTYEKR